VSKRVDFSTNAPVYDRRHGAVVSNDELSHLWETAALPANAHVLDGGAGTGRVAIPVAGRGCTVVAIEPAFGMLEQLRVKDHDQLLRAVGGEGAALPFSAEAFDVVVVARLLYLTADWKEILQEVHRVLSAGGCLLHQWGNGDADECWVQIRDEARRLFEDAGVRAPFHPGARSESAIDQYLGSLGFIPEANIAMGAGPETTIREFLRRLAAGELSYIWRVPAEIRASTLPVLHAWVEGRYDLDQLTTMPRELRWSIHRKPA
jgi:SAM-dependent methyltransferase